MDIYTLNENCMAREIDLLHNSAIRYDVAKNILRVIHITVE